jgi:hypothetical protein
MTPVKLEFMAVHQMQFVAEWRLENGPVLVQITHGVMLAVLMLLVCGSLIATKPVVKVLSYLQTSLGQTQLPKGVTIMAYS